MAGSALGFGIGALLAGIACGIAFALMGDNHGGDDLSLLIAFEASVPLVLYPCVVICLIVGFSHVNREPSDADHEARFRHVRDYRPLLVALYPPVVLFANLALMAVLVVRLAPGLGRTSLAHAFTLPGMWSVLVVPIVFLVAMIIGDVVTRWITAQPPLYLPQDAAIRQRADDHLRRWVIGRLYSLFWLVVYIATQGQFFLLDSGGFGHSPLMIADLNGWFTVYFVAMLMGGLVFASLVSPPEPPQGKRLMAPLDVFTLRSSSPLPHRNAAVSA